MALVDKSLLHRTPAGQYELHELLRQYALESLDRTQDAGRAVRDRHSAHYAAALADWATTLKGPRQQATLAEIEANIGNARVAWDWAARRGQAERLDQAMQGLGLFYRWRCRYQEGESAFRLATDKLAELAKGPTEVSAGHLSVWAGALTWQGFFLRQLGRTELARELLEKSLDLLDDPVAAGRDTRRERAFTLRIMGHTQRFSGDIEQARRLQAQSLALYRALGDRWETAYIASELGHATQNWGDFEEAGRLHQEALDIRRALGDPKGMIHSLGGLAAAFTSRGQLEKAERLAREALALCHEAGERTYYLWVGLFTLVQALHYKGEFVEGHVLLEEGLPISGDLTAHKFFPKVLWLLGMAKAHLGRYKGARVHLQRALILARKASAVWIGAATFGLGLVALAGQEHNEARRWLQESVACLRESRQRSEVGWALAGLGGAMRGLGRLSEAQTHLCKGLQITAEIRDLPTPMHALPVAALLLADLGRGERAVEIYALASRYGFVANSRLWEDIAGHEIAALAATLPPEVVAAAQERGRARDLWATVEELLVELAVEEPLAR
jgi:tetratricopeptide (TPR) repeat protein